MKKKLPKIEHPAKIVTPADSSATYFDRNRYWAEIVMLAVITLLTYANTLHDTEFVRDNAPLILQDARVHSAGFENLKLIFTQDYWQVSGGGSALYRPLTTLSYLFNYAILGNGEHATGYHVVNVLLHIINVILVFWLFRALPGAGDLALFVAAIFAVHPVNVEAVTNICGRADLFATGSVLAALLCYLRATTNQSRQKIFWLMSMTMAVTIGLFCKEISVVILVGVVLYDFTYRLRPLHRNWLLNLWLNLYHFFMNGYVLFLLPLLIFVVVRRLVFSGLAFKGHMFVLFIDNPLIDADFWAARLTAIKVIGKYLWILIWPSKLAGDYSYNQIPIVNWPFHGWEDWQVVTTLAVVMAILCLAIRQRKNNKVLFFSIFWLLVCMLPTANLLPRPGEPLFESGSWLVGTIMAERLMYLPSIGFAACLVIAIEYLGGKFTPSQKYRIGPIRLTSLVLLALVVVSFAVRSFQRNYAWESEFALWSEDITVVPNNAKANLALANHAVSDVGGNNIDLAIAEAEKALAITDRYLEVLSKLGLFYRQKGNTLTERDANGGWSLTPQSRVWYEKSVAILQKAVLLSKVMNEDEHSRLLRAGRDLKLIPDFGDITVYENLGVSLRILDKYPEALQAFQDMRHLAPYERLPYLAMGEIFNTLKDFKQAAISLHQLQFIDNKDLKIGEQLIEVYEKLDPEGCAVDKGQPQASIDGACPLVQQLVCEANFKFVEVLVQAKEFETAWQMLQSGIRELNCPPADYVPLMPPGIKEKNLSLFKAQE